MGMVGEPVQDGTVTLLHALFGRLFPGYQKLRTLQELDLVLQR